MSPDLVGRRTDPREVAWTDQETLVYAVGVGETDLRYVTDNTADAPQQVLPTFAVVACNPFGLVEQLGLADLTRMVHGADAITLARPLTPAGSLLVTSTVSAVHDGGPGRHATIVLTAEGRDPVDGGLVVHRECTLVLRGAGGFGGTPAPRRPPAVHDDRAPDLVLHSTVAADQAVRYRLTGDRNRLHTDPAFARAHGFDRPILHGLCTFGMVGADLVREVCAGRPELLTGMSARFTAPVLPGDELVTSVWLRDGGARFATVARTGDEARTVLADGGCTTA